MGDPLAAGRPQDGVERGDHAGDGRLTNHAIANVLVKVRLAVGDDEKLVVAQAVVDQFLQGVFIPHERSPWPGEKTAGGVTPPAGVGESFLAVGLMPAGPRYFRFALTAEAFSR